MFQSEMSDLMSGVSPELLLLGHEEEIENQVSEILLQDFKEFQKFALQHQGDDFNKKDLMEELAATNDVVYPSAKPSDITGQSLAVTMETDKSKVLSSMLIPTIHTPMLAQDHVSNVIKPATVDIATPDKTVQASKAIGVEETQEVIEEIQDFLDQFTDE